MTKKRTLPWEVESWHKVAHAWIRAELKAQKISINGEIGQLHIRPWSTVLTVPTSAGTVYFKASAQSLPHETALTQALARWHPMMMPSLIAVDLERGWMLMRSSGTPLRTYIRAEQNLSRWKTILPDYVRLQKDLTRKVDELLSLGTFDRRLTTLPAKFSALLTDTPALLLGQPDGLTTDEMHYLRACVPEFTEMCERLASFGFPESLHHDDFHDANVFMQDGRAIFTDWGESAVTHPFFTLIVLLRGAENSLGLSEDAPELEELRDYYLENWRDFASPKDLLEAASLSQKIGLINRALTWHHVISQMSALTKADYASAVPSYLQDFIKEINR